MQYACFSTRTVCIQGRDRSIISPSIQYQRKRPFLFEEQRGGGFVGSDMSLQETAGVLEMRSLTVTS